MISYNIGCWIVNFNNSKKAYNMQLTPVSGYSELPRDRQKWFTMTEVHYNWSELT